MMPRPAMIVLCAVVARVFHVVVDQVLTDTNLALHAHAAHRAQHGGRYRTPDREQNGEQQK